MLSNLFRMPLVLSNSTTALSLKNALVHVYGMKHLTLVILLALAPLSWGEIKFDCTGTLKVMMLGTGSERTFESTDAVYLQNEKRPFTLRYRGETLEVDYFGEQDEFYLGRIGEPSAIPSMSMSMHRMTLQFNYQNFTKDKNYFSFRGDCEKAKPFKPKI